MSTYSKSQSICSLLDMFSAGSLFTPSIGTFLIYFKKLLKVTKLQTTHVRLQQSTGIKILNLSVRIADETGL